MKSFRKFHPDLPACELEDRVLPVVANLGVIVLTTGGYVLMIPFPGASPGGTAHSGVDRPHSTERLLCAGTQHGESVEEPNGQAGRVREDGVDIRRLQHVIVVSTHVRNITGLGLVRRSLNMPCVPRNTRGLSRISQIFYDPTRSIAGVSLG